MTKKTFTVPEEHSQEHEAARIILANKILTASWEPNINTIPIIDSFEWIMAEAFEERTNLNDLKSINDLLSGKKLVHLLIALQTYYKLLILIFQKEKVDKLIDLIDLRT
ncbi:MAG: hypothetical protein WCL30_00130 [Pseudomonadota bacterium]